MSELERQILLNQISIMAGLKRFIILSQGNARGETTIARFEDAIQATADLLRNAAIDSLAR